MTAPIQPKVTIIVPVYKTEPEALKRLFISLFQQSLKDIEIIAINDSSPDICPEILDEFAEGDSRLKVIHHQVNTRAGKARMNGLKQAKGEYILFADADDYLESDMCETLYDLGKASEADIVSSSWLVRDNNGHIVSKTILPNTTFNHQIPDQKAHSYQLMNFALWNKLFRRSLIQDITFQQFEVNISEDTLFNLTAHCKCSQVVTTSYTGYNYIIHDQSATGNSNKGYPYLRTLESSGNHFKDIIQLYDNSQTGLKFLQHLMLNRFIVGSRWISEQKDIRIQTDMWLYWKEYFINTVYPELGNNLFANCLKWSFKKFGPGLSCKLTIALYLLCHPPQLTHKTMSKIRKVLH